jgi:hypothetical protein
MANTIHQNAAYFFQNTQALHQLWAEADGSASAIGEGSASRTTKASLKGS